MLVGASLGIVLAQILAATPLPQQRVDVPTRLAGSWRSGGGDALCFVLQIKVEADGSLVGILSDNFNPPTNSLVKLRRWRIDAKGDLEVRHLDGRVLRYTYIPSPFSQWTFVNGDVSDLPRIDFIADGNELLIKLIHGDRGSEGIRYRRTDSLCDTHSFTTGNDK